MISDDAIDRYLGIIFGRSEPGEQTHSLLMVTADSADHNALGLPDPDKMHVKLYAIAPVGPIDVNAFISKTIVDAISETLRKREIPYFAALILEIHSVHVTDGNEVTENLARRLTADHRLQEHPEAVEVSVLYAACRDGRRWHGEHILTGGEAGKVIGPKLMTGPLQRLDRGTHRRLIRSAAGLT